MFWVTWLTQTRPITIQWKKKWKSSGFITAFNPNPIRYNPSKEEEDSSEFHHSHYKPSKGEGVSSVYHHGSILIPIQPTVNHKEERSLKNPGALKNRQLTWKQLWRTDNSPGSNRSSKDNRELRISSLCYELLPNYTNQTGTVKRHRTLKANVKELISFNTCSLKESCDLIATSSRSMITVTQNLIFIYTFSRPKGPGIGEKKWQLTEQMFQ